MNEAKYYASFVSKKILRIMHETGRNPFQKDLVDCLMGIKKKNSGTRVQTTLVTSRSVSDQIDA